MSVNLNNIYLKPVTGASGQALTVSNSVVTLFPSVAPNINTQVVMLDIQTDSVYVTFNGETPSAGNGHLLVKNLAPYYFSLAAALQAKFIRVTTDAVVYVSQWSL